MKTPRRIRRIVHEMKRDDAGATQIAVGAMLLMSLIYVATFA